MDNVLSKDIFVLRNRYGHPNIEPKNKVCRKTLDQAGKTNLSQSKTVMALSCDGEPSVPLKCIIDIRTGMLKKTRYDTGRL